MKIVVLYAHSLHLGYLGCYGNEWVATPALDQLAAEGIVFDQHYADHPLMDAGGVRAAWTGRYHFPGPESAVAEPTGGTTTLAHLVDAHQILFSQVIERGPTEAMPPGSRRSWRRILDETKSILQHWPAQTPGLLWVDLPSLSPPWQVPEEVLGDYFDAEPDEEEPAEPPLVPWLDPPPGPFDREDDTAFERLQTTYAAAITHFDAQVARLLHAMEPYGGSEEISVCLTAANGLPLGEHGIVGNCRPWLHDELIHLPLILRLPGGTEAGRRIGALTQPVDLLPTILEVFGVSPSAALHGQSLWPLIRGQREEGRSYACAGARLGDATEWAVRTAQWAYILPLGPGSDSLPRGPQLYVKPDDRWEVNNVLQHHLELAEHLDRTLRGFVEASRRPGSLEAPELREIEKLP
jgi:arylsulfatase A-like enzyme